MKNIITINRQFGSGGREIGKRLADELGWCYYDKELISKIAEETGLCKDFINKHDEKAIYNIYPFSFGKTFTAVYPVPENMIYIAQTNIIREIADAGDCIIIGRCASHILKDEAFKILVYSSDIDKVIDRCYEKVPADKDKSRKEMENKIKDIDKQRSKYHEFYTGEKRLDINNYNLCIDTAEIPIKEAVKLIASLYK